MNSLNVQQQEYTDVITMKGVLYLTKNQSVQLLDPKSKLMEEKQIVSHFHCHQSIMPTLFTAIWFRMLVEGVGERERMKEKMNEDDLFFFVLIIF